MDSITVSILVQPFIWYNKVKDEGAIDLKYNTHNKILKWWNKIKKYKEP